MKTVSTACPNCTSAGMSVFYEVPQVPAHSVLLLPTREEAIHYPKGDIQLAFCTRCGFITNLAFDPSLQEYSTRYEETQGFSPTFNAFHQRLAEHLIARYNLHHKSILEIGCGKGEFLLLLCELGNNRGLGFDPAYVDGRLIIPPGVDIRFIQDFYGEEYAAHQADFVVCKMTLEHIAQTAVFLETVNRAITNPNTTVFFQIPNVRYVLRDFAFWDVYYEHCSYFSHGSLAKLFRRTGFDVLHLWTDYDDQYLMIEAKPQTGRAGMPLAEENDLVVLSRLVKQFESEVPRHIAQWKERLREMARNGRCVVLWGGGSKAVAFLTTLNIGDDLIAYAVDINPHKAGTHIAGTGQAIVPPTYLPIVRPDVVILMNPIYHSEVSQQLQRLGLQPEIISLKAP